MVKMIFVNLFVIDVVVFIVFYEVIGMIRNVVFLND